MMHRTLPLVLVVVIANAVMLAGGMANRRGQPEALVRMTERELTPAPASDRNSARELELRVASGYRRDPLTWLDAAKLASIGFDCHVPPSDPTAVKFYARQVARRAFAVFEYDGPAWQSYVRLIEADPARASDGRPARGIAAPTPEDQARSGSRLVAVDAGLDPVALRAAHPDRSRFLVLPAVVVATVRTESGNQSGSVLTGYVNAIARTLVVPRALRDALDRLAPPPVGRAIIDAPRYAVSLAVGRRYEPWIVAIEPLTP